MTYRKKALLLTLVLSLLALFCLLWICLANRENQSTLYADIYQNGTLLQSIRLDQVVAEYTFTITGSGDCWNEIAVRPGSIGIVSASCPDKLCVHQGFIHSSLLPITCLPNRLVIQVREVNASGQQSLTPDIISY